MIKVLLALLFLVGFLVVLAMALTDDDSDFLQAREDEDQENFLEEWRRKHGRK